MIPFYIQKKHSGLTTWIAFLFLKSYNMILVHTYKVVQEKPQKNIPPIQPGMFFFVYLRLIVHRMNCHWIFSFYRSAPWSGALLITSYTHSFHPCNQLSLKPHILPRNPLISTNVVPAILNAPRLIAFPRYTFFTMP